jgi:hypothetical protein
LRKGHYTQRAKAGIRFVHMQQQDQPIDEYDFDGKLDGGAFLTRYVARMIFNIIEAK